MRECSGILTLESEIWNLKFGIVNRQSQIANKMNGTDWENRYQTQDMPWEKGAASPGLIDFLSSHPGLLRETVCVPGCGTGHDVRAWAQAGFKASGFDIAPTAIQLSIERTRAAGLKAEFEVADFLKDKPPRQFDWLFEHTLYCAIQPQERAAYRAALERWLKPGGYYLAVNYFIPNEDGPPFGTHREEIWTRFSNGFHLLEEWEPRSYPNRVGLERMFWWKRLE